MSPGKKCDSGLYCLSNKRGVKMPCREYFSIYKLHSYSAYLTDYCVGRCEIQVYREKKHKSVKWFCLNIIKVISANVSTKRERQLIDNGSYSNSVCAKHTKRSKETGKYCSIQSLSIQIENVIKKVKNQTIWQKFTIIKRFLLRKERRIFFLK